MKRLKNIHPGEILQEEFLIPLELSAYKLSKDIGIPQTRISEILKGNRRVTADTALRLSKYFETLLNFGSDSRMILTLKKSGNLNSKSLDQLSTTKATLHNRLN